MRPSILALLFIVIVFLLPVPPAAAQWRNVLKAPSYGMAWNPKNPKTIYVGGEARAVYRTFDGGETWDTTYIEFQGSGEQLLNVVVHPVDTSVVIVGGSRFGVIRRSSDCGKTWDIVLPYVDRSHAFLGESIIIDKTNSDILYAADFNNGVIYRSANRGLTWDSLSQLPREPAGTTSYQQFPCSITQRSDSTNVMFVGCLRSTILKSEDTGRTWRRVTKLRSSSLDEPEVPQIHFSKSDPLTGYAVATYFFYRARPNGGIYKTTDGGETWKEFRFRDTSFWSMDSRPLASGNGDELVVGGFTEYLDADTIVPGTGSILRTLDDGETWWNYKDRIPYAGGRDHSVITLRFVGTTPATQRLVAATIGGTCILEPDGLAGTGSVETSDSSPLRVIPTSDHFRVVDTYRCDAVHRVVRVVDILGRVIIDTAMQPVADGFEGWIPRSILPHSASFVVVNRSDGTSTVRPVCEVR
ncbi:MAG: WD40/YVTN/BNR-like repeat-containing protein [Candidatus Kapaibacterium sp.]